MSPRHFFHELRRVARESYAVALVPTAVVLFCAGLWYFLWLAREPDPSQAAELTPAQWQLLAFFDGWWPYLGWILPFLIVKRLDTEDRAGMQRTLPLTRSELLGAKLAFTFLTTVALPTAAFAVFQAGVHPENWLAQTGAVAATQWLLAGLGAGAALLAPGLRGAAWLVGAYVLFQYVSGATTGTLEMIFGPVATPVFEGTPRAFLADACALGLKYAPLLLAPLAVAALAVGVRRFRPVAWLLLAVPLGIITPPARRTADAPRFARTEAPEQATLSPLTPQEAKAVAKEPWFNAFKEYYADGIATPAAKAQVTLHAPGLVPAPPRSIGRNSVEALSGFVRRSDKIEATTVCARLATRVDTESFWPRSFRSATDPQAETDRHDRIARLVATGAFPRDVRFWRLGATPKDDRWQTVSPSPDEVRFDLTLVAPTDRLAANGTAPESVTVEVPFTRYAAPEILLRTPATQRAILRERDLVVSIPKGIFYDNFGSEYELSAVFGYVERAGPFHRFGSDAYERESVEHVFVVFNPVTKQAVFLHSPSIAGLGSLRAEPQSNRLGAESPRVDEAWLKQAELLVVRLRALETVKRLVEIRPAATTPAVQP